MLSSVSNFMVGVFGSRNQRLIKRYASSVAAANALEAPLKELSDDALRAKTTELKARYQASPDLEPLLPEAFALVREAARRTLGMRHFDVQLIGGITLHQGKIAEMRTGEGKTLVATLSAYLNALSGQGVHVVTVNEYLAQRDADWMGPVYRFLGLSVGVIKSNQPIEEKRQAYAADITYGTNNEFGFDYLRDNLAFRPEDRVQRMLSYAIVDEVDSILIDEARTPLIISGRSEESTELYVKINQLIPSLKVHRPPAGKANDDIEASQVELLDVKGNSLGTMSTGEALARAKDGGHHLIEIEAEAKPSKAQLFVPGDYTIDEKSKQAHLTEEGHERVEDLLLRAGLLAEGESLYDAANIRLMHHLTAALRAHGLFKREVDYIVREGEVIIVDEFTGRTMIGRRWSDGLHQAVEAKEGVHVKEENQTVASITFQNYFRMYKKLAGMTGTADTEAFEFQQIYGLEVVVIPTHKPMVRDDAPDLVYLTQKDKFDAIIEDITDCHNRGQPVLVGTTSIETSEFLSGLLKKNKIPHQVLNAKYHEREAEIIMQAGRPGTVTIATNMAGRGTDIVLGGAVVAERAKLTAPSDADLAALETDWNQRHAKVIEMGGLHIIGTERHESRRIDNQLRGRSGRQGDPGSSRFYLSLEDNLMRIFGDPERIKRMLSRAGMKPGEVIESKLLSRQIERAQRKVEAHNFDIRKQLLEYDDVANDQRRVVYQQRSELMDASDIADAIRAIRAEVVNAAVSEHVAPESVEEEWDKDGLGKALERDFGVRMDVAGTLERDHTIEEKRLRELVVAAVGEAYDRKVGRDRAEGHARDREADHAAAARLSLEGAHRRARLPATRHPPARLRAAQSEAGVQARGVRDVQLDARARETRHDQHPLEDPDSASRRRAGRRAATAGSEHAASFQHAAAPSLVQAPPPAPEPRPGAPVPRPPPPTAEPVAPYVREQPKVGRNDPCPCGSGKKFKQCHGRLS